MRRRFWRHVAKFAAKRAGLHVVSSVQVGSQVIWPTPASWTITTGGADATWTYRP